LNIGIEVPGTELLNALAPKQAVDLARALDASGVSYAVLGGERDHEASAASPSPTIAGALLARHSRRVGLVVAASPQRDHPFNLARRTASLDHISAGRAGVLALSRDRVIESGLGAASVWATSPADSVALADAIAALRKLWRSWPLESLDADPSIAQGAVVRFAAHDGIFSTRGPLNSPSTPQGEPVVFWRWREDVPVASELAALQQADVVQVDADSLDSFLHAAGDFLDRAQAAGEPVHIHVRSPWSDALESQSSRWRDHPHVQGITLLPHAGELHDWLADGRIAQLTRAVPEGRTLRERLGIARRIEPDLSGNAPAFEPERKKVAA
jgi:alkanesulfonate monooxygenase SsuD/methylene tetrahydromethanopterin reductase-like flavin-dependent oxidoreductase (luciferase family)